MRSWNGCVAELVTRRKLRPNCKGFGKTAQALTPLASAARTSYARFLPFPPDTIGRGARSLLARPAGAETVLLGPVCIAVISQTRNAWAAPFACSELLTFSNRRRIAVEPRSICSRSRRLLGGANEGAAAAGYVKRWIDGEVRHAK
jgi:hypothetical protein